MMKPIKQLLPLPCALFALALSTGCDTGETGAGEEGEDGMCVGKCDEVGGTTRVLVTGFYDWNDPNAPFKCDVNPTCMLTDGDLLAQLEGQYPDIEWEVDTLVVSWGSFLASYQGNTGRYDYIVNLGLNASLPSRTAQVERDAVNIKYGADVFNTMKDEECSWQQEPEIIESPPASISRMNSVSSSYGSISVDTVDARDGNSFICNETHADAIVESAGGTAFVPFFVHVSQDMDGHAADMAAFIGDLVD